MGTDLRYSFLVGMLVLLISGVYGCSPGKAGSQVPATTQGTPGFEGNAISAGAGLSSPVEIDTNQGTPAISTEIRGPTRGVWVQASSITTRSKIDEMLQRAEMGGFDAIFVNVFLYGQSMYDSSQVHKYTGVVPDFDPLGYLVQEAHRRNIRVHAWFVVGSLGEEGGSPLASHPEWRLMGPDGETTGWLNFTRPDARQFISDLMQEVVERYPVDGLHFDYTRYPDAKWGFDPYSIERFQEAYGHDLSEMMYADLPAYGVFEGNPLILPGSAQILAVFSNGLPAVVLNSYGEGKVVLLNWDANKRNVAIGSEVIQRSLRLLLKKGKPVYLLHSETNAEVYGDYDFQKATIWLQDMGWSPVEVFEAGLDHLEPGSALILPNVYLISTQTARKLANYVQGGGGIIFIDGPTRSFHLKDIQALTGMQMRGRYFKMETLMTATGESPFVPTSERSADLDMYRQWQADWDEFRKQGINDLIQEVYRRIKLEYPQVQISVTVTANREKASREYMQDWPSWLSGDYIDLLIPRFYVDQAKEMSSLITGWQPDLQASQKITVGLIVYTETGDDKTPKPPQQLLDEIRMAMAAGSHGIMVFDLDDMNDAQLQALADEPLPAQRP